MEPPTDPSPTGEVLTALRATVGTSPAVDRSHLQITPTTQASELHLALKQQSPADSRALTVTGHSCFPSSFDFCLYSQSFTGTDAWQRTCKTQWLVRERANMLRVELRDSVLKLEGRLTAADADLIRTLITRSDTLPQFVVDLTEVTFVDSVGEAVLSFLGRLGAEFVAETAYSLNVCERLHLRLAANGIS